MPTDEVVIERISTEGLWPAVVAVGDFVFVSGTFGRDENGALVRAFGDLGSGAPPRLHGDNQLVRSAEQETASQIWAAFGALAQSLEGAGSSLSQIVLMNGWYADFRDWPIMNYLRGEFFDPAAYPVSTGFGATALPYGARVMYEAISVRGDCQRAVVGGAVQVGTYAGGSRVDDLLFLAGEVPADPETGRVVRTLSDLGAHAERLATGVLGSDGWEGPIRAQAWYAYERIKSTLEAAGSGLGEIVKQNVYLRDLRDYPAFHRLSSEILGGSLPATNVVSVAEYGHAAFNIEIEVTARTARVEARVAPSSESAADEYPAAVQAGPFVFLSGLTGVASTRQDGSAENRGDASAMAQTSAIYDQAQEALAFLKLDLSSLVRQVIYVTDIRLVPAIESVAARRTQFGRPATTIVGVPALLPGDACVQIDFTAAS